MFLMGCRMFYELYVIVGLRVHVEIVHDKVCQGSNMRPRESFSEFANRESIFFGERFSERF